MADVVRSLGVDPGSWSGGAAVLSCVPGARPVVRAWFGWTFVKSGGGRLRYVGAGLAVPPLGAPLFDAACILAALGPYDAVVVEGLFVASGSGRRAGGRRASTVPLAESAGELLGPLRSAGPLSRPSANEWRHAVLGLPPGMAADECEARAVTWARGRLDWAAELPRWGLTYAEEGAVCEAACMAFGATAAAVGGR